MLLSPLLLLLSTTLELPESESLSLEYTVLTTEQWTSLLTSCSRAKTLNHLRIANVNLAWAEIPSLLIGNLALSLQTLDFSHTNLNIDQVCHLLKAVTKATILTSLNLQGLDLSEVPCETLVKAVISMKKVCLKKTKLTPQQSPALLASNLSAITKLRDLDLSNCNLSSVPGHTLAISITRLREADLSCTWLTKDQVSRLVKQVAHFTRLEVLKLQEATASLLTNSMAQDLNSQLKLIIS